MSKGNWLVNGTCLALLLWGGFTFSKNWKAFAAVHQVSLLKSSADHTAVKGLAANAAPVAQAWTDILSHNPFSFDRNDIDIAPVAPPAPHAAPPKPVLFGTMNTGNGPVAMLGDPGARQSSQTLKVGERFKSWTVVRIEKRSVVVETDGVEESLVMGNVPIDRDGGKTSMSAAPPPVTTTTAAPPAPVPTISAPASPAPAAIPAGTTMIETPFGPKPVNQP